MKKKPDCSGVELSGGDVKDGEGSGGTELAKENQDGEGDALRESLLMERSTLCFLFLETFSSIPAAMQQAPGKRREATCRSQLTCCCFFLL